MSVFLSVGAGFKICCLEFLERSGPFIHLVVAENNYSTCWVWLSCVSLNWTIYFLFVFVSVVSCVTLDEKTDLLMFAKGANM